MEAVNQLVSTFIWCLLVLGWLGVGLVLSGIAILIYRFIAWRRLSPVPPGVWLWATTRERRLND